MMRLLTLLLLGACTAPDTLPTWSLVWEDEFDGPLDAPPDPAVWTHDVGGDGWGNNQLEFNTDSTRNAFQDGEGLLHIVARKEDLDNRNFTSARITTKGAVTVDYGRIEASIQLPAGQGLWPAFWMLGSDIDEVSWPGCGEIDIMEFRGQDPEVTLGTLHGPGYSGGSGVGDTYRLPEGDFTDGLHEFAVEIDPDHIAWYVDDVLVQRRTPADIPRGTAWVFDHEFFLILNLAVGGTFLGPPDETTPFPAEVLVDRVSIYERNPL